MSKVAEILMQEGQNAQRTREAQGAIWGGAVAGLGQVPNEILAQRHQQQQQALQTAEVQQRLALQGQQGQMNANTLAETARSNKVDAVLGTIPRDADGMIDLGKTTALAAQQDPALVPHVQALGQKLNTATGAYQEQQAKLDTLRSDRLGEIGLQLLNAPTDVGGFHLAVSTLADKGLLPHAQADQLLTRSEQDPTVIATQAHQWIQGSPTAREAVKPHLQPVSEFGLADPATGKIVIPSPGKDKPMQEQLLEAVTKGDSATADRITQTLGMEARAKQDPGAAALALELKNLSVQEAQERLKTLREGGDQNKLEQQYRTVLARGLSSRSGGLGLEDGKVQQANHLMALMDQNYDPKTGNYNIPGVMQEELALGLARLTSPNGQVGVELANRMNQPTAYGKMQALLSYVTGTPQTGSTQAVFKMFHDSIQRQGEVANQNREGEMRYLRGLAPTALEDSRRQQLEATSLNPLRQSRIIKNAQTGERKLQVSIDGGETWK